MSEIVAKRYVKALIQDTSTEDIQSLYDKLVQIGSAYSDEKFNAILSSSDISGSKKVELILSFVEDGRSEKLNNFIKFLGEKQRLDILPYIVKNLQDELAAKTNSYTGVIYTNTPLNEEDVEKLRTQFANKFNVSLELEQNVCDYDGIKVDIDGLGCEIAFSKQRLKSQMIEHILKAV
jgi:F-type H+-transporting ATPase subunit delta